MWKLPTVAVLASLDSGWPISPSRIFITVTVAVSERRNSRVNLLKTERLSVVSKYLRKQPETLLCTCQTARCWRCPNMQQERAGKRTRTIQRLRSVASGVKTEQQQPADPPPGSCAVTLNTSPFHPETDQSENKRSPLRTWGEFSASAWTCPWVNLASWVEITSRQAVY